MGVQDLGKAASSLDDLVSGDTIFAATGVTDGSLLEGVKRRKDLHHHRKRGDARERPARSAGSRASTGPITSRAASTAEREAERE